MPLERRSAKDRAGSYALVRTYSILDFVTEGGLYFALIFAPWAFGTTEKWSIWILNYVGYGLGAILVVKFFLRTFPDRLPPWIETPKLGSAARAIMWLMGVCTLLLLTFTLVAAWNARAELDLDTLAFTYFEYNERLPFSYDQNSTYFALFSYIAFACYFWAARDWLIHRPRQLRRSRRHSTDIPAREDSAALSAEFLVMPARLKRLLWVISINGGILAVEGILQRLSGTNKLLWHSVPWMIQEALGQFGPYAYRSNAAQYFNLTWPVVVGFWWGLTQESKHGRRRSVRVGQGPQILLLPIAILMAACPAISTSRGGALVSGALLMGSFAILLVASRRASWKFNFGIILAFTAVLVLVWSLGWQQLIKRFKEGNIENLSGRLEIYVNSKRIAEDYPLFGTGPGTFASVYQLYRANPFQAWQGYLHDDWLETRVTFGWVGFSMVIIALLLVASRYFCPGGIGISWEVVALMSLGPAGCLVHAKFDFPFQIYSITFTFIMICAVLFSFSRKSLLH